MSKQAPDLLSWALLPLIVGVVATVAGLFLAAALAKGIMVAGAWIGDLAQATAFDDCE